MTLRTDDLKNASNAHDAVMLVDADTGVVSTISKAELEQRVEIAHRYPRSLTKFRREALDMATVDELTAKECVYALPRREYNKETRKYETKIISGPSVRLAEILLSAWGNTRAGTRIIDEGQEYVTSQGLFYDLEKNVEIQVDVKRRITNAEGKRYSADMIVTTANAASSIALRNAVIKGIPRALWSGVYEEVRKVIAGDAKTLSARRENTISTLNKMGISNDRIFGALNVSGISDIGLDEIVTLIGFGNAIKENDVQIDDVFPPVILNTPASKIAQQQPAAAAEKKEAERESAPAANAQPEKKPEIAAAERKPYAGGMGEEEVANMLPGATAEKAAAADGKITFSEIVKSIAAAKTVDHLRDVVAPMLEEIPDQRHRNMLQVMLTNKMAALAEAEGQPPPTADTSKPAQPASPAAAAKRRNVEMS